jgi:hypothetical protein
MSWGALGGTPPTQSQPVGAANQDGLDLIRILSGNVEKQNPKILSLVMVDASVRLSYYGKLVY